MDTLVFDIETQNFFTDPGVGWNNYDALKISVIGIYSYGKDQYVAFDEAEIGRAAEFFRAAGTLVGFSMNRYDIPVLYRYFQSLSAKDGLDLWAKNRIDLLSIIEETTGDRISLDKLAWANLGKGKSGHGAHAIELYHRGRLGELKEYCLTDVRLTKELYDLYRSKGEFLIPHKKTGEIVPVRVLREEYSSKLL